MSRARYGTALVLLSSLVLAAPEARALVWPDVPERVERGLASADPASRRAAARELASLGTARATPLVLSALGDPDVEVRLAAADSAIRLHVPAATEAALQWLGERESRLRVAACEVALAMPAPGSRAVPALARALGDADPHVRAACADALGAQDSPDAVAPLSGKLDDPTPNVRIQVAHALAKLGDERAVVPLVGKVQDSVPEVRQAVVRALGDLGDARATQALLLALRDNIAEVKMEALSALGRLRAPEGVDAIAPLLHERNPGVRQAALTALGRIATPSAVRALIGALGAREDAARSLEATPVREALVAAGPKAAPELTALLARPSSPAVATSAAWVLGELRMKSAAPAMVAALRKGALPPAAALHALSGAGTAAEVPVVLEFVADPSPLVREQALRAAAALLDPEHPDGRAVEPLAATLGSPRISPKERAAVATLLGRTGAPRAASKLVGLLGSKDRALRIAAIDALGALGGPKAPAQGARQGGIADPALVPLLDDDDPVVRLHAAVALAESGGPKARDALLAKLAGDDELDRFAVLAALGGVLERHPDEAAAQALFGDLALAAGPERDALLEAAGRARSPRVISELARVAKTGDVDDRRTVAAVLGAHRGSAAAVALAHDLLRDSDGTVRAQAAFTLGEIGDASVLPLLAKLAGASDRDLATNAAAAVARLAPRAPAASVARGVCPLLDDARATVRANALAALARARTRCGDGDEARRILAGDPSPLARAAAARAVSAAPRKEDRVALDRCVSTDRSAEVARACRPRAPREPKAGARPRAVTVFIVGETGTSAKPHAPFLLEYDGGLLRAGVADRRGATFDAAAPPGDVTLRAPPR